MSLKGYSWANKRFLVVIVTIGCCLVTFACTKADKGEVDESVLFEKTFTEGEPDLKVEFPEDTFAKAKDLRKEKKPQTAEKLLLNKLDQARKSSVGTTKLGKYLVRLNNVLFDQGKDEDATKYGEIALKIFYAQPLEKRPLAPWFSNIHSYLGMSYDRLAKYPEAEKHFLKAIKVSSAAPKAEVSETWMKLLYSGLAGVYKKQNKKEQELKVRQQMLKLYNIPIPKDEEEKESSDKDKKDKAKKGKNKKTRQK